MTAPMHAAVRSTFAALTAPAAPARIAGRIAHEQPIGERACLAGHALPRRAFRGLYEVRECACGCISAYFAMPHRGRALAVGISPAERTALQRGQHTTAAALELLCLPTTRTGAYAGA